MWFWLILIGVIVIMFMVAKKSSDEYMAKRKEAASNLDNMVKKNDFSIDKRVEAGDGVLVIDSTNKKWSAISTKSIQPKIYNFKDLIEYEVYEDGDSIAQGRAGSAAIGSLFGTTGAIIGGARSQKVKNTCNLLQIRIRVNDINLPEITMTIIGIFGRAGVQKDSKSYRSNFEVAKQMVSYLSFIQNNGIKVQPALPEATSTTAVSAADEIEKFKRLFDNGAITQEEYEEKKKQLLGL